MPLVTIKMLEGRTLKQKKAMVEKVTQAIVETLDATPENVFINLQRSRLLRLGRGISSILNNRNHAIIILNCKWNCLRFDLLHYPQILYRTHQRNQTIGNCHRIAVCIAIYIINWIVNTFSIFRKDFLKIL